MLRFEMSNVSENEMSHVSEIRKVIPEMSHVSEMCPEMSHVSEIDMSHVSEIQMSHVSGIRKVSNLM